MTSMILCYTLFLRLLITFELNFLIHVFLITYLNQRCVHVACIRISHENNYHMCSILYQERMRRLHVCMPHRKLENKLYTTFFHYLLSFIYWNVASIYKTKIQFHMNSTWIYLVDIPARIFYINIKEAFRLTTSTSMVEFFH